MKFNDILFWIIIALIIGLALWKLFGSPTDTASLIALALFVAGSELLIWRAIFKIDKNTSIGFVKVKSDINNMRLEINNKLNNINNKLTNIEGSLRRKE